MGRPEHGQIPVEVRPIVMGFNDGIVSILALVAGVTGALTDNGFIILAGIVGTVGGAISMALGGYISSKSEVELYKSEIERERREIERLPTQEKQVIRRIFHQKGFRGKLLNDTVRQVTSNKSLWLDVVIKDELGFVKERLEDPKKIAFHQGVSFVIGALVPIVPYLFFPAARALPIAVLWSAGGLFLIGALKTRYTGRRWLQSAVEHTLIGMVAAAASYYVGSLVPLPADLH